ncbi:hypothetical protein BAUCODRAFT_39358 [Baudoinia panamericana UAMH 10762]|uniref:INO80 complex subunit B-like conserved region domain-containing protein n=1 Tax=Baudoinia panamericana (strain UAMH 10762) TaxID=717646 RepID=M2MX35_BAUPA|nr:uncharacterized protein BAUCODRAFT_39358 [Baudoinia panamericana UAMH 10762]EMC91204.1 hypothetical protein BAUCODRAFT_39358 [Baudoinia panamericana UAMH 10762]
MDYESSNKRFKTANGTPIAATSTNGASALPAYQPPAIVARGAAARTPPSPTSASVRSINPTTHGNKPGLRLTVKAPASKLRQATSSSAIPPNPYAGDSDATPAPRAARSTRNPRALIEPDSEVEDEDEDAEGEEDDIDRDLLAHEDDSEEDAEGEEDEMDMDEPHPPPPIIKQAAPPNGSSGKAKPNVTITAPPTSRPLKSVEAKELALAGEDEDEDEELSELEEGDEDENDNLNDLEDDNDIDHSDDDDEGEGDLSRSATPDLSKLTRRQRGQYEEIDGGLMALSNEAQKKKHLTAEEHAMRRAEMARRRKNLSEKRNEEEKVSLLSLQTSTP